MGSVPSPAHHTLCLLQHRGSSAGAFLYSTAPMVTVTSGTNGCVASEACPIDLQPVLQGQELLQWFHSLCSDCDQLTKLTNQSMVRALKLGIESSLVLLYSQIPFFPRQLCRVDLKQAGAVIMHKIPCLFTRAGSRKEVSSALTYPQVYYQYHIK